MGKWDRDYVREKYGYQMLGQHVIYYPSSTAKGLIVIFSSMGKDRFDRYSWFWSEDEEWHDYAYLFIKDDSFKYFLGDDEKPLSQTFRKIITHHTELAKVVTAPGVLPDCRPTEKFAPYDDEQGLPA